MVQEDPAPEGIARRQTPNPDKLMESNTFMGIAHGKTALMQAQTPPSYPLNIHQRTRTAATTTETIKIGKREKRRFLRATILPVERPIKRPRLWDEPFALFQEHASTGPHVGIIREDAIYRQLGRELDRILECLRHSRVNV